MSASLYWMPVEKEGAVLSDALRLALQGRYSLPSGDARLDYEDTSYLKGLLDAGIADAQVLVEAIQQHSSIILFLRY